MSFEQDQLGEQKIRPETMPEKRLVDSGRQNMPSELSPPKMESEQQQITLIDGKDEFSPPVLIDRDLAKQLILTGQQRRSVSRVLLISLAVGFFGSMLANILHIPFALFLVWIAITLVGISYAKTRIVVNQFRARRFDKATQALPSALESATQMYPFTHFQYIECMQTQLSLLIIEGRFAEFEAVNFFNWGATEKNKPIGTVPKSFPIAANYATGMFLQHNYETAATIFQEILPTATRKSDRLTVMCNLSYCLLKSKRLEDAERCLYEALELNGKSMESLIGMRLQFMSAYLLTEKGEFDSAELSIQHAFELSVRLKQPDDYRAYFNAGMAEIRRKQKRFDEAELFFQNAIDIFAAADNPTYFDLAIMYRDFSQTLFEAGKQEDSAKQLTHAHECYDFYVKRETETVDAIRNRLRSKKQIRLGSQLLNLGSRVKSIEVVEI